MLGFILVSILIGGTSECRGIVSLIGVPSSFGGRNPGSEFGPSVLRNLGVKDVIESAGFQVEDLGNVYVPTRNAIPEERFETGKIRYRNLQYSMLAELTSAIRRSLLSTKIPFIAGGDHAMAIASIGAPALFNQEFYGSETGVFYFDNHADIHTPDTTWNGNLHALPLSFLLGLWKDGPPEIQALSGILKPENIVYIGLNSLETAEEKRIRDLGILNFRTPQVESLGIERVLELGIEHLRKRSRRFHLSFDLDWMKGVFVPGVGTPEEVGGTPDQSLIAARMIASSGFLKSWDLVELSPPRDIRNRTSKIALEVIKDVFQNWK